MIKKINYSLNDHDAQMLPADKRLEKMILGLLIDVPSFHNQMKRFLDIEGVFYETLNAQVWEAMTKLINLKLIPNKENLIGHFTRAGNLELANYATLLPSYAGELYMMRQYALKLSEMAILRNIIRLGYDLNQKGFERQDALELLAQAGGGIGKLYGHIAGFKEKTMEDGVNELAEELVEIANSPDGMLGIKGSIPALNRIFKGYRRGNLIVVAASSGEGKTTLMLQEASFMAWNDIPIGIMSLEMPQSELLLKICCEKLDLDIDEALSGKLTALDMGRLSKMLGEISKKKMYIVDTPGMKIGEIRALARTWKTQHKIKALFVDHLHLVNGDIPGANPEQKFTDIANQLKELSKELDIPVIALAQLARKDNQGEKRRHIMTDLKYAGGIEQAADVVIMIFRPEEHGIDTDSEGNSTKGNALLDVVKLRLLRKGTARCQFNGLRFTEEEKIWAPRPPAANSDAVVVIDANDLDAPF